MPANSAPARLDGVDLLRGLAIFFVLMNHVNMRLFLAKIPYADGLPDPLVSALVWNGQRGVQIFFAVSGFLITSISLRRWQALRDVSLRGFYLMRLARILPLLALLLVTLSALHLAGVKDYVISPERGGLGRALLAALTFRVNVLEARHGYLPGSWDVLWSLSVEEMFYLCFPIVCRVVKPTVGIVMVLAGFVLLGPFARTLLADGNEVWREYSYLGSMDAIALGCLTALVAARVTFSRRALRGLIGSGAALLIFGLGPAVGPMDLQLERAGLDMTFIALGACLLIAGTAQTGWKAPRLLRPLLQLGRRSYEVYLVHMFVVFALFRLFLAAGASIGAVPALFVAVIGVSALVGELVSRYFSEPLNRAIRDRWQAEPLQPSIVAPIAPRPQG